MASMELEFSGAINPSLKWKVPSKGRKRTERRPRTLFTEMIFKHITVPRRIMPIRKASASKRPKLHEALDREGQKRTQCNKKKPTATRSKMSQSPTCKEPKRGDIPVSESEKLGAVLGKHFSGTEVSVSTNSHKQIISKYTEVSQDTIGEVPRRIMPIRKVSVSKKNYANKQITVKHTEVSQDTIGEVPRRIMPIRKASASKRPILHEALDREGQKKTRCNRKKHIAESSKKSRAPTCKGPKWDVSVSESEKLAVVLLWKRFRDAEIFVPVKKRRIYLDPSSMPLDGSANRTDFDQGKYAAHGNRNPNDIEQASHEVTDFSGLLLLASAVRDTRFINDINNVKVLETPYVDVDIEVERGIYEEKIPNAEKSPRMVDLVGAEDDLTNNSIGSKINGNNHASGSDGLDNNSSGEVVLRDGLDNNSSGEVVLRDCAYCGTDSQASETGFVQAVEPGKVERLSNDDSEYEDGEIRDSVINVLGEEKVEGKTDRDAPKIRSDTQNVTPQTVLQVTSVTDIADSQQGKGIAGNQRLEDYRGFRDGINSGVDPPNWSRTPYVDVDIEVERGIYEEKIPNAEKSPRMVDLVGAKDDLANNSIGSKINGNNHASGSDGLDNNAEKSLHMVDLVGAKDDITNNSIGSKINGKNHASGSDGLDNNAEKSPHMVDLAGAKDDLTNNSIGSKINGNNHASGSDGLDNNSSGEVVLRDGLDNNSSGEVVLRDCAYCSTDSQASETGFVQAVEPGKVERLSNDDSEYEDGEIRDSVINESGEEKVEGKTDRDAPKIRSDTQNVTPQTVLQVTSVTDISDSQRGKGIAGNQRLEDYRGFRDGTNSGVDPPNRSRTPSRYNASDVSKSISSTVVLGSRNYLSSQIERPMMSNDLNRKDGCYVKASRLDETIDRDFEFGDVNVYGSFRRCIPSRSTPNRIREDDWADSRDHWIPVCHSSGYRDSHHFTPHRPRDASSGYRDPHYITPHWPRDAFLATSAYLERNGFVLAPDGTVLSPGRSGSFGMEQGCDNLRGRSPYRSNDARWSRTDRDGHRVVWMRGRENHHAHGSNSEPTYRGGQSSSLPSGPFHLSRNYTRSPLRSSTPFFTRTSRRKSIDRRMDSSSMRPRSRTPYLKSEAGEDSARTRLPERARSVHGRPDFKSDRFKESQCKRYSESRQHTPDFSQDQKFDQMQSPDKGYHLVRYGRFPGSDAVSREPRGHNLGNPRSHGDGCEVKNLTIQCNVDGAVEAVQKDVKMSKSCDV